MSEINLLDEILLSNDVQKNFINEYENNPAFKNWLLNILPQIEDCKNQEQNNPWHKYNVLDHILYSVEAINAQTINLPHNIRKLLTYTMFYHDIGKPKCHIVRNKNGQQIDSFFNHNIESARIVNATAQKFGFDPNEQKILETLVFKHDIFMFLELNPTTNKFHQQLTLDVVKENVNDLNSVGNGVELMNYLLMIGRADNLAQNEKMTANSLKLLDEFKKLLDTLN